VFREKTATAGAKKITVINRTPERAQELSLIVNRVLEDKDFEKNKDGSYKLDDNGNKINKTTIKAKGIPGHIREQFTEDTYNLIMDKIKSGQERIMFFGTDDSLFDKEVFTRGKFVSNLKNNADFDKSIKIKKGMNLRAKQKRNINYKENYSKPWVISKYESLVK
jgi:hypothetical protein